MGDGILDIEQRRGLSRDRGTLIESDAVGAVDNQTKHRLRPVPNHFSGKQFEPFIRRDGGDLIDGFLVQFQRRNPSLLH